MIKPRLVNLLFFCIASFCTVSGFAAENKLSLPEHPERGLDVFVEKSCVACHTSWGAGGNVGPDLSKSLSGRNYYQIVGLLWNHSPRMFAKMKDKGIPIKEISSTDMQYLIAYLYYLNFLDPPGEYEKGEKLFQQKKCVECHSLGGNTGKPAPALDNMGRMISPIYFATYMWNHRVGMTSMFRKRGFELPKFYENDLANILAYIRGNSIDETEKRKYLLPGNPNAGLEIFKEKKCILCHSVFGIGGKIGPDLGVANLSKSITELSGILWNHMDGMEIVYKNQDLKLPKFEPQGLANLLTYLFFTGFYDDEGDIKKGAKIFEDKKCASCHPLAGEGSNLAPDLATGGIDFDSFEFPSRIWNHSQNMGAAFDEKLSSWPIFRDDEMRDLIYFLKFKSQKE